MLYYSQGKGDTDEKVKNLKTLKASKKQNQKIKQNKKMKQKGLTPQS